MYYFFPDIYQNFTICMKPVVIKVNLKNINHVLYKVNIIKSVPDVRGKCTDVYGKCGHVSKRNKANR